MASGVIPSISKRTFEFYVSQISKYLPMSCFCSCKSPLHLSCAKGHAEMCQFLVECKADVNAKDKGYGIPCTRWSLLRSRFGIRCSCRSERSALHWWSEKGNSDVCRFLVECRADVNAKGVVCETLYSTQSFKTRALIPLYFYLFTNLMLSQRSVSSAFVERKGACRSLSIFGGVQGRCGRKSGVSIRSH